MIQAFYLFIEGGGGGAQNNILFLLNIIGITWNIKYKDSVDLLGCNVYRDIEYLEMHT